MTETENVATYARIRPYNPAINEDKLLTARAVAGCKVINKNGDREDTYNFTRVFGMTDSTNDAFNLGMKPLLDFKILQGINSIFIVYGQSGSGKSFTLIGEEGHLGVLPMSLQYLLNQDCVQRIDVASIEAYGIKAAKIGFYDLVAQLELKNKMKNKYDPYATKDNSRLSSDNAKLLQITKDNCLKIITELQEVSHMAPTLKNPHSSRGHTVYFCRVKMKGLENVYFICIDLAGSEGQTALGTKDEFVSGLKLAMSKGKLKLGKKQMKSLDEMYKTRSLEAGCINNGLTQLQCIFGELIRKKISKAQGLGLRKVLSSFISLKSAYAIMFTLSASANNNKVTRATLNFAKQTQLVKVDTQKAKAKIDKDAVIAELNELIEALKKELGEKGIVITDLQNKLKDSGDGTMDAPMTHLSVDDSKEYMINVRLQTLRQEISAAEEEEAKWTYTIDPNMVGQSDMSETQMKQVFDKFDTDSGGSIDEKELQNALADMGMDMSKEEVDTLFKEIDTNGDGEIDFDEFKVLTGQTWFMRKFDGELVSQMEKMMSNLTVLSDEEEDNEEKGDESDNEESKDRKELLDEIKGLQREIKELKVNNSGLQTPQITVISDKKKGDPEENSTYGLLNTNVTNEMQKHDDQIDQIGGCAGCLMRFYNKFNNKNRYRSEGVLYHQFE